MEDDLKKKWKTTSTKNQDHNNKEDNLKKNWRRNKKKMEDDLKKKMQDNFNKNIKMKTNQSTKINLIGCDTIANSPSSF